MRRPNLAADPFPNLRPLALVGTALGCLALGLTAFTVIDLLRARGSEHDLETRLQQAQARRSELARRVEEGNRRLAAVKWRKLETETSSLATVVARRTFSWSALLGDLERVMPWDTRLVSIQPAVKEDGSLKVTLQGIAASREAWLKLLARLFADTRFSDPLPQSEEAPGAGSPLGTTFQVTATYWPEGRR